MQKLQKKKKDKKVDERMVMLFNIDSVGTILDKFVMILFSIWRKPFFFWGGGKESELRVLPKLEKGFAIILVLVDQKESLKDRYGQGEEIKHK